MNFPSNIEDKIGFNTVKEHIIRNCSSDLAVNEVEKIRFISKKEQVEKLCRQTVEFCHVLIAGEKYVPIRHIDSLVQLKKAKIPGSYIESQSLNEIRIFLDGASSNLIFFKENEDEYPTLSEFIENFAFDDKIPSEIFSKVNEKGEVRDDASPELRKIRREIVLLEDKTRKIVNSLIAKSKKEGFTPDDASITIRNGRLVIPVRAEHKRKFKGFIHDESASGQTSFIEPAEALELNNKIIELTYQEHREIVKILIKICDHLRNDYSNLEKIYGLSSKLDFIRAKAIYANKITAICPEINSQKAIQLIQARHPILEESLKKQKRNIVPLDISLDHDKRILVISGPNAGGKSVTLKTIGLLQYMFQCGIPIPVSEGSSTYLFEKIFIDIGDEQSIENDLSTYSSHLKNMAYFVYHADKKTLFLIDEFGTGTDPKFGGAIAESILMDLVKKGCYGALSTHYSNLKKVADKIPGLSNARMRFDVAHLEPLFQLEVGKPGSSFALEIATKIGLPPHVIQQARKNVGYDEVQLDNLLNELEKEKNELVKKLDSATKKDDLLEKTIHHYQDLKVDLEERKKEILNKARLEAKSIISTANQKIENAIFRIKQSKAEKEVIKNEKANIENFDREIELEKVKSETKVKVLGGPIGEGDFVRIKGNESVGEVINLFKKSVEVSFGSIKSNINISKLEKVEGSKREKTDSSGNVKKLNFDINESKSNYSSELDLRGKHVEEAHSILKQFMDYSIMFSSSLLKIIHGKGNGVLRSFIRQELSQYKEVERMEDEHADRGGSGVTVVYLK